jgi:hypothetical protein
MMEEIVERENLKEALRRVKANKGAPGVDGMTVNQLDNHLKQHWPAIREHLLSGTYKPKPVKRVEIPITTLPRPRLRAYFKIASARETESKALRPQRGWDVRPKCNERLVHAGTHRHTPLGRSHCPMHLLTEDKERSCKSGHSIRFSRADGSTARSLTRHTK